MIPKKTLIYDIECSAENTKDISTHELKFIGFYSYKNDKFYFYEKTEIDKIKKLFQEHKFLVGFNNKQYDNIILNKSEINFNYKIIIDLYKIIEQRMNSIMFNGQVLAYQLKYLSLDFITQTLNLVLEDSGKIKIDYDELNHENINKEKWKKYTLRDIEITKKLFEWLFNYFDNWKHHLNEKDRNNLKHLTSSPSVYAYKVICNKAGIKEEYAERTFEYNLHDGAYVSYPAIESLKGNIYCLDYASLYPHIMIQCNLFGRKKDNEDGWNGNSKFKTLGIYDDKKLSKISKVLMEIYNERKKYKKEKNPKEYGLKITMNIVYGLLRNPTFKNLFDEIAGNDCCTIGQQFIKLAIKRFKENGYFVFYTDTDSVYLEDKFNNKEKLLEVKNNIMNEIKENIPFPVNTFDMDIDYEIEFIQFFKGNVKTDDSEILDEDDKKAKELGLLKKNYLFVYKTETGNEIFIKNLGIVKRSNSDLSKKIFWEKMTPIIKKDYICKFNNEQIKQWIREYLEKDISLIAKRFSVAEKNTYKSKTCINIQIYDYIPQGENINLGKGNHFLIPNIKMGVGKGIKKYCTLEEYNNYLSYNDLNTEVVMKELSYFNINYVPQKFKKQKEIKFEDKLKQLELW